MYAKTIPIRVKIKEKAFEDYIININRELGNTYRHYKYPTKKILKMVKSKDNKRKRTSKIWFSFQNIKIDKNVLNIPFSTRWTPLESTYLYDMLIELYDFENNGSLDIIYNYLEYKYSKLRMVEIHNGIYSIIEQVLNNPKINIQDIIINKNNLLV